MANSQNLAALPVPLQGIPAPGYNALDLRRREIGQIQEGVLAIAAVTDFKVTQRAAGAGAGVDVTLGEALVLGDAITFQGLYYCLLSATLTAATQIDVAAGGAQPRIDQIVLEVKDTQHDGSGLNVGRVRLVQGTETAGATLDNRLGAAALPSSAVRLADVLQPAGNVNVAAANIRDRRPWARGLYRRIERLANAAAGSNYTTLSTSAVEIDAVNIKPRLECTGNPIKCSIQGRGDHNTASALTRMGPAIDGTVPAQYVDAITEETSGGNRVDAFNYAFDLVPSAGTHLLSWLWRTSSGTATLYASATAQLILVWEEIVRQNADNT